jgi:enterochelin esterase-like enzyme
MPDVGWLANNTSGAAGSLEQLFVEELLPHIEASYCLWAEAAGRALGGLSRGGYWSLEIAFRHPELFASVGGHSPALLDVLDHPDLNPQYTAFARPLGGLRIYLDVGQGDYLQANVIRLHEEMVTAGIAHDWSYEPGSHEDAYWAERAGRYLEWYAAPWPRDRSAYPSCA